MGKAQESQGLGRADTCRELTRIQLRFVPTSVFDCQTAWDGFLALEASGPPEGLAMRISERRDNYLDAYRGLHV